MTEPEAHEAFAAIMDGRSNTADIAALLTAMHVRGETQAELAGAVRAARARMMRIAAPPGTIDVCGTGGDGLGSLNVSTAVSFVVAACGVPVAKHGNRAMSSRAGAADVLACLGIDIPPAIAAETLERTGLVFLFAPNHHPALRNAAEARAALGFRTLFNLVGPLCNPAGVTRQLLGVFSPDWLEATAAALGALGAEHAWVVHGQGLDELTLAGVTQVCEWRHGTARLFEVAPEAAGLPRAPISAIAGGEPAHNARLLVALLEGQAGAYRDTVVLNAAAALIVAGRAVDLARGAAQAAHALASGAALAKLHALQAASVACAA